MPTRTVEWSENMVDKKMVYIKTKTKHAIYILYEIDNIAVKDNAHFIILKFKNIHIL